MDAFAPVREYFDTLHAAETLFRGERSGCGRRSGRPENLGGALMLALIRDQEHNPPLALREVAEPEPSADEALIEVHASSVNRGELALLAARLAKLDDDVSFIDAAALGLAGRTALRTVWLAGPLLRRNVLVLGAAGGVGHLVVQLAARAGAHVTAASRDPCRVTQLVEHGADRVLTKAMPTISRNRPK